MKLSPLLLILIFTIFHSLTGGDLYRSSKKGQTDTGFNVMDSFSATSKQDDVKNIQNNRFPTLRPKLTFAEQSYKTESREIHLKTKDGLIRKGILTIRENAKGNVILCHPASFNKEFLAPFEQEIFSEYNCLRFDFRRHGELTHKQYCTIGKKEVFEIRAAVLVFKTMNKTKNLPLYGFGISMGAVALIEAESQHNYFDGLILQAPFDKLKEQVKRMFPFFNYPLMSSLIYSPFARYYARKRYGLKLHRIKPIESIRKITQTPIFLIHAQDDPTISFEVFKTYKRASHCICQSWTPKTGKHTELFKHQKRSYIHHCKTFLNKIAHWKQKLCKQKLLGRLTAS